VFVDRLIERVKETNNPSVAGLDPKIEYVPESLRNEFFREYGFNLEGAAKALLEFNRRIIDSLCDIVPAVKLQLAYYEMYGTEGIRTFKETLEYARQKGMITIADGKRNDIGSTAQSYSAAYLGEAGLGEGTLCSVFDADALTVNPYLGYDGIKPFLDDCEKYGKGIFILVKTSNESSGQLQDLVTSDGRRIYEVVAELIENWGSSLRGKYGYSSVGAVVGATYPQQAKVLRKLLKHSYILVPGYGAQGGTAEDAALSFDKGILGAVVNASRSIMCAYKSEIWREKFREEDFDKASRAEAERMRDSLLNAISRRS